MKSIIFILLGFFISISLSAQKIITGFVKDKKNEPVMFINVILKDSADTRILAFTQTNENGYFELSSVNKEKYQLSFSGIGYETKRLIIESSNNNQLKLDVELEQSPIVLNEVIVHADIPIREKKDTVVFSVKAFADGTEQVIEDLLKKIPGISVDEKGVIKVGNKEIERLMIDGDDFFEKGYKIIAKNMPVHPVEKVELLQRYSKNHLLKGVEDSEKYALNLRLKEEAKRFWFGNINVTLSPINTQQYLFKSNLMNFGNKNKFYFLTNANNIGVDAIGDVEELIRPVGLDDIGSVGDDQQAFKTINIISTPTNFSKNRTNFNNDKLVSLNSIFNPTQKLKIKSIIFLNSTANNFFNKTINTVAVKDINFINTEDYQLFKNGKVIFGKLDLTHDISKNQNFQSINKFSISDNRDKSNILFNGIDITEKMLFRNYLIDNKNTYTVKLKQGRVLLLNTRIIDDRSPQNYQINNFQYQISNFSESSNIAQNSENRMRFYAVESSFLNKSNLTKRRLELHLGSTLRDDLLISDFNTDKSEPLWNNDYKNLVRYISNDTYLKSKYFFPLKNFSATANLEIHQLYNYLIENNISRNQAYTFLNHGVNLDWNKQKHRINTFYNYNLTNASIIEVYNYYILTGFRNLTRGSGNFNQIDASTYKINYQFGNWNDRTFANLSVMYIKNHNFFTTNTTVSPTMSKLDKVLFNDRNQINYTINYDYYIKSLKTRIKTEAVFSFADYKNIINDTELRSIKSKNYLYSLELRSGFKGMFNYYIGTKWNDNNIQAFRNIEVLNNISFLDLSFNLNKNIVAQLQCERYSFTGTSIRKSDSYYFTDFDIKYAIPKNKLSISLSGKNLFNTTTYHNYTVNDIGSVYNEYRLLPRFVLLRAEYSF